MGAEKERTATDNHLEYSLFILSKIEDSLHHVEAILKRLDGKSTTLDQAILYNQRLSALQNITDTVTEALVLQAQKDLTYED